MRLYHWMLESEAWRTLDPVCRAVYLELSRRYSGTNNGRIGCSIRDMAAGANVGKSTVADALVTLAERGFIVREIRGRLGTGRAASEWRLTEHGSDVTGGLATKDFMRWRPEATT